MSSFIFLLASGCSPAPAENPAVSLGDTASIAVTTICELIWMARNLDVVTCRTGDPIPEVQDPREWVNLTTGAWYW